MAKTQALFVEKDKRKGREEPVAFMRGILGLTGRCRLSQEGPDLAEPRSWGSVQDT